MCTVLYEYAIKGSMCWKESTLVFDTYEDYVQWYDAHFHWLYGNPDMHILLTQINKG